MQDYLLPRTQCNQINKALLPEASLSTWNGFSETEALFVMGFYLSVPLRTAIWKEEIFL